MINGSAGGVEILMWHCAKGKPVDRVETGRAWRVRRTHQRRAETTVGAGARRSSLAHN